MTWSHPVATKRIEKLIAEAPEISVNRYAEDYLPSFKAQRALLEASSEPTTPPLFDLPKGRAILVDTVQIYINIVNYDEYRIEEGRETETSHAKALKFLHLYYSACDRVMEASDAQRVDFHGGRMHCVILNEEGLGGRSAAMASALAFVTDFQNVADGANRELVDSTLDAQFRIGIDIGQCVAINNGNGLEQEPMFLGKPANYAAKLTYGDEPGIYLSDRASAYLPRPETGNFTEDRRLDEQTITTALAGRAVSDIQPSTTSTSSRETRTILNEWRNDIVAKVARDPTDPQFVFQRKDLPLSSIVFDDLKPSKSIRMDLASMFADLSGYTDFIDNAIEQNKIPEAVKALYVIRQEWQNVVEEDFDGRKIRFIGDCIHAISATGDRTETDAGETVADAVACAGALRSSFKVCQEMIGGLGSLGITIGIEFGPTPVTRLGIRGKRSVRLASSITTAVSEKMQRGCDDEQTRLGENAIEHMPEQLSDILESDGLAHDLTFDDVAIARSIGGTSGSEIIVPRAHNATPAHVPKAHLSKR